MILCKKGSGNNLPLIKTMKNKTELTNHFCTYRLGVWTRLTTSLGEEML